MDSYIEIKRASDRLAYLMAVGKYEGTDTIARALASHVLDSWGREVCPVTGQHFFYVCSIYGGSNPEDWTTPARVKV